MPERRAAVTWEGNLPQGHGTITDTGSGALTDLPITWAARTESSDGKTSPEELLAAAQAACFAMAFSATLGREKLTADSLQVNAVCTFDRKPEGGWKVGSMTITVTGRVPGITAADFTRLAEETGQGCPISGALKGNVEISVHATLES